MKDQKRFNLVVCILLIALIGAVINLYAKLHSMTSTLQENQQIFASANAGEEYTAHELLEMSTSSNPSQWLQVAKAPNATENDLFNVAVNVATVSNSSTKHYINSAKSTVEVLFEREDFNRQCFIPLTQSQLPELLPTIAASGLNNSETLLTLAEQCVAFYPYESSRSYVVSTAGTICLSSEVSQQCLDKLKEIEGNPTISQMVKSAEERIG